MIRLEIKSLHYDLKREAAKMSALSSVKIAKYKNLTSEEILPSNKRQLIEHAFFFIKSFWKTNRKTGSTIKYVDSSIKKRWIKTSCGYISTKFDK